MLCLPSLSLGCGAYSLPRDHRPRNSLSLLGYAYGGSDPP